MTEWREELPNDCPDNDAIIIDGKFFYRLSLQHKPNEKDFQSKRAAYPAKDFGNISECLSRSLSVWSDYNECLKQKRRQGPKKGIGIVMRINITQSDGVVKQTFDNLSHYSWWVSKEFDYEKVEILL